MGGSGPYQEGDGWLDCNGGGGGGGGGGSGGGDGRGSGGSGGGGRGSGVALAALVARYEASRLKVLQQLAPPELNVPQRTAIQKVGLAIGALLSR